MASLVNPSKYKEAIICNSLQSDPEGTLPNSFYKVTIPLLPDKDTVSKERYRTISAMNTDAKKSSTKY